MKTPQGRQPPARRGSAIPRLRQPRGVGCPTLELPGSLDGAGQGGVWPRPSCLGVEAMSGVRVLPGCLSRATFLPGPGAPTPPWAAGEGTTGPSSTVHPPLQAHQQFNLYRAGGMVLV